MIKIVSTIFIFSWSISTAQGVENKSGSANKDFVFTVVENPPVFPGCANLKTKSSFNRCMNTKISQIIGNNFDLNKTKKLGVTGRIKIYVKFIINKKGEIEDIDATSPSVKINTELKKEIKRVFAFIPAMEKPALSRGRPISVPYTIPLSLNIPEKRTAISSNSDKILSKKEKRELKRAARKLKRKLKQSLN